MSKNIFKSEPTAVVFRRWPKKEGGRVIALFPYEAHDPHGMFCVSYERQGGHAGATYDGLIPRTKPVGVFDTDVKDLIHELTKIGYDLKIITKAQDGFRKRQAQAKAYRESAKK